MIVCLSVSGCYLGHLARGQIDLLRQRVPISEVLSDSDTSPDLRSDLETVQAARRLAAELGLEVQGQYTSYVAWPGDRVVTVVVTTLPGEIEPAGQTFPLIGRVPYRGYFDLHRAETEARRQRESGRDVCVVGVPAYSTLGWFDDPITGPMLQGDDADIVQLIVHELVHGTFYVNGQARFNEGVATFIGEEAGIRYAKAHGSTNDARQQRERVAERRLVQAELSRLRDSIQRLYRNQAAGPARSKARTRLEHETRDRVSALPLPQGDPSRIARELRLNDACLALSGTYSADLPRYASVLEALGGDLMSFTARARQASEAPDPRATLMGPPLREEAERPSQAAP
ncbi:aminopeptidase [Myxococcota bacterium]|nr:aminopeptidase [Myxococcota bacterium]